MAHIIVSKLIAALVKVKYALEFRNNLPILSCAYIGDGKVMATNLDLRITVDFPAADDAPICLPFMPFYRLISSLPPVSLINLTQSDNRLVIDFNDGRASLMTMSADDFPVDCIKEPEASSFDLDMKVMASLVPFVSSNKMRPYLNGVHICSTHMEATNGHILGRVMRRGDVVANSGIVSRETVKAMVKLFKPDTAVTAIMDDLSFKAVGDGVTVNSKLIDGKFPNTGRLIPAQNAATSICKIDGAVLKAKFDRICRVAGRRIHYITQVGANEAGRLESRWRSPDIGAMSIALPGKASRPFTVYCNPYLMADVLQFMGAGDVDMRIISASDPVVFCGSDKVAVLMPMRGDEHGLINLPDDVLP